MTWQFVTLLLIATAPLHAAAPADDLDVPLGGDTTVDDNGRNAFSHPAANLSSDRQTSFFIGNSFFKRNWIEAPASASARDGLGPHFIARSCGGCHLQDGRGAPPAMARAAAAKGAAAHEPPVALLFRLSIPGTTPHGAPKPEPTYGEQFANDAVTSVRPEGRVTIRYREQKGRFRDGTPYLLRAPTYAFGDLAYGPMHPQTQVSPRLAPQVIGMGLLDAIRVEDIEANAARQRAGDDGIAGRPNRVWDAFAQAAVIGRFGWKANVGSVAHQVAAAFNGDIGITSTAFPREECTEAQADCRAARRGANGGGEPEIDGRTLQHVIFYARLLAVPAQRERDHPQVRRGAALFAQAQCASCHVPAYVTGEVPGFPELSQQRIRPYTDLLLHDMGPGLADGRPDFAAGPRDWRTPPLWGIGLIETVNDRAFFLHDGRARDLSEAILWHGGEAQRSRDAYVAMSRADRASLLRFLKSL